MSQQHPKLSPYRSVLAFFFRPADPTTLGWMRIVTGCLVLYTHIAYSFDLKNFFGPDAWVDHAMMERQRKEYPSVTPPLAWEDPFQLTRAVQLPEPPHRKAVVLAYLHALLDADESAAKVEANTAFLARAHKYDLDYLKTRLAAGRHGAEASVYLSWLAADERDRANQLAVLVDESQREAKANGRVPKLPIPDSPACVNLMAPEERAAFAKEAEAMWQTLPKAEADRAVVLVTLSEMDMGQHDAFLNFARRVAAEPRANRLKTLDYLAYWNVDPKLVSRQGEYLFSFWFHLTDPTEMAVAHGVCLVIFFLFTVGFWTRMTAILTWLAAASYLHRSVQVLFGMDTMMNILLFYLMIGNSGAALSVDRLINRYRAVRRSLDRTGTLDPQTLTYLHGPALSVSSGFALRLLQIHFCFIYMASGLAKLKGNSWWNTNAFWDTMANPEFTLIYYQWYENGLRWVVSSRPVYAAMAAGGVVLTFVAEIGLPLLVWTRLRPYMVMFGLLLHTAIAVFMGLIVFSLFMMTLLLCYLPGVVIRERLFGTPAESDRVKLRLAAQTPRQRRAIALALACDFDGRVEWAPAAPGPVQVEAAGATATGDAAVAALFQRLPWLKSFRALLHLPGAGPALGRLFSGAAAKVSALPAPAVAKLPAGR